MTQIVLLLISKGANAHAEDAWGPDAMFMAATEGHIDTIRALIDIGSNQITPGLLTEVAAMKGTYHVLRFLLIPGADQDDMDKASKTALFRAVENHIIENVRVLLEFEADPEASLFFVQERHHREFLGREERIADERFVGVLESAMERQGKNPNVPLRSPAIPFQSNYTLRW